MRGQNPATQTAGSQTERRQYADGTSAFQAADSQTKRGQYTDIMPDDRGRIREVKIVHLSETVKKPHDILTVSRIRAERKDDRES